MSINFSCRFNDFNKPSLTSQAIVSTEQYFKPSTDRDKNSVNKKINTSQLWTRLLLPGGPQLSPSSLKQIYRRSQVSDSTISIPKPCMCKCKGNNNSTKTFPALEAPIIINHAPPEGSQTQNHMDTITLNDSKTVLTMNVPVYHSDGKYHSTNKTYRIDISNPQSIGVKIIEGQSSPYDAALSAVIGDINTAILRMVGYETNHSAYLLQLQSFLTGLGGN